MQSETDYKLEQYCAAAAIIKTTPDRLIAQDALGPMCESCNPIYKCISHKCPWFVKCYPQYKDTVAKEWLPEGY